MNIFELTECSDHCPIEFYLNCEYSVLYHTNFLTYDNIVWDNCYPLSIENMLNNKNTCLIFLSSYTVKHVG